MSADTVHPAMAETIANDRVRDLKAELANVEQSLAEAERKLEQLRNALKRWVWADANEEPFVSDNLCDCADEVWGKGRWL